MTCTCPVAAIDAMGEEGDLTDTLCPIHGEEALKHNHNRRVAAQRQREDEEHGTSPLEKFRHVWEGS